MSDTKPKKGSTTRRAAGRGAVGVLDKAAAPKTPARKTAKPKADIEGSSEQLGVPVPVETLDGLDDILGEILPPARPEVAAPDESTADSLDDILSEIAPAPAAAVDSLDDILSQLAPPAATETADSLDDILSELAPAPAVDPLADILSELAEPEAPAAADSLDDILGEVAPVAEAVVEGHAAPADAVDDFNAMLNEMALLSGPAVEAPSADAGEGSEQGEDAVRKPGIVAKLTGTVGSLAGKAAGASIAPFKGRREISRAGFAGLIAVIGVLTSAVVGETTYIIARPAGTVHHAGPEPAPAVTVIPVDYSKVDLTRYHDKIRVLHEGGRDLLRNPAIKEAILNLDNGEELYEQLRQLARGNAAADRVDIRNDRVTIDACDGALCGAKSFKLVYRLASRDATACISERHADGTGLTYSYGPDGYKEWPSCDGIR